MLITALVFLLIAGLIMIAAWRSFTSTEISGDNKDQPNLEYHPHKLKEAAMIEAAQELHPFEEKTKRSNDIKKTETSPKKSHIQAVPDNVEKMVKRPLAVPNKAEEKAKSPVKTAPRKAEEKDKKSVIAIPRKAEEKVKKTVMAIPHTTEEKDKIPAQPVPLHFNSIPALALNNEIAHQQGFNQSIGLSSITTPVALEKQLDNIVVTENELQTNVYNELVKQLAETSVILEQINEQLKLVELMNYIDDEFTKLSMTIEHQ